MHAWFPLRSVLAALLVTYRTLYVNSKVYNSSTKYVCADTDLFRCGSLRNGLVCFDSNRQPAIVSRWTLKRTFPLCCYVIELNQIKQNCCSVCVVFFSFTRMGKKFMWSKFKTKTNTVENKLHATVFFCKWRSIFWYFF